MEPEELEECEWLIKDDTELLEELLSPSMAASQVRQGMEDAKERAASRLTRREKRCMMLIIGFAVTLRRCQKVRGRNKENVMSGNSEAWANDSTVSTNDEFLVAPSIVPY